MVIHYFFHLCNGNKCADSKIEFNPNVDFVEDSKGRKWHFEFAKTKSGKVGNMLLKLDSNKQVKKEKKVIEYAVNH